MQNKYQIDIKLELRTLNLNFKTNLTSKTLKIILERYKGTKFIWLMGADNLKEINRCLTGKIFSILCLLQYLIEEYILIPLLILSQVNVIFKIT